MTMHQVNKKEGKSSSTSNTTARLCMRCSKRVERKSPSLRLLCLRNKLIRCGINLAGICIPLYKADGASISACSAGNKAPQVYVCVHPNNVGCFDYKKACI